MQVELSYNRAIRVVRITRHLSIRGAGNEGKILPTVRLMLGCRRESVVLGVLYYVGFDPRHSQTLKYTSRMVRLIQMCL